MKFSVKPSWHRTESGSPDGVTVTFRAGDASLCMTVLRPAVGSEVMRGASALEYLRARGATVTVCPAPRFGVAVAGALDPVTYVEGWRWRRDPKNVANARETSLWFSREFLAWRWRAEPRDRSEFVRNTKRDGFATWRRVILGEQKMREVASYDRAVIVSLPEGDYKATARITVDEELRSRVPEWLRKIAPKFVRRVRITTEQRVHSPYGIFGYTTSYAEAGDDVDGAAQRFAADVERCRAEHPNWSLPLKMRAVAGAIDTWDAYHYASGEWRRWGVSKRESLPKEAVVENETPLSTTDKIAMSIMYGALAIGGFGLYRREVAMAGRR